MYVHELRRRGRRLATGREEGEGGGGRGKPRTGREASNAVEGDARLCNGQIDILVIPDAL